MNNCYTCGFANQVAARFCGGCGTPLKDSSNEAEAERRVICVIFCDMVGATALSEQLDIEEFRSLLHLYHSTCSRVVNEYDGFLADLMGDGAVIYFGYPKAHEDDDVRAVLCALAIQKAIQEQSTVSRHPFQVRIGIHRGRVVVGALGALSGVNSLAIGDTPNIASRLQAEAQPGEVVVSDTLWRLIMRDFNTQSLGSRRLKGLQRSIEIHRIIRHQPRTRSNGMSTAFIGRQGELDSIESCWQQVVSGVSRGILVRGEPGIGKSRLIQQLFARLNGQDMVVMEALCSQVTTDTPYFPLAEMLRERLRLHQLSPESQLQLLTDRISSLGLPEAEAVPLFALILSLEIDVKAWPILEELSLIRQRQRTQELLVDALAALAKESPVLLIVEDLHWADASTIEVLTCFHRSLRGERIMMLYTARLEFRSPWSEQNHIREILLNTLTPIDAEQFIRGLASNKAIPNELTRQVCLRSGGNPLFLEEITLSMLSSPCVIEREHTWELIRSFSTDIVPASMEAALMARLDRIGEAKTLLQIGATLGREFRLDLLSEVASLKLTDAEEAMDRLVDEGFLRVGDRDQSTYIFKHALIQDTAYESLLRSTRLQHHARIAVVIEEKFPELVKQRPELMAHHLSGAERYEEAAKLWLEAGQLAAERYAVNEGIDHLNRGLKDLKRLPEGESSWNLELMIQSALAPVQMASLGWASPQVETTCWRAIHLAERLGIEEARAPLYWGLWSNQFVAGKLNEAMKSAKILIDLASQSDSAFAIIPAKNATSYTYFYRGEYQQAILDADSAIPLYNYDLEIHLCKRFQCSQSVHILSAKGNSLWMAGQQSSAHQNMDQMMTMARGLNHMPTLATGLAFYCLFHYYEYNWKKILGIANELLEITTREGYDMWKTCADIYKTLALLELAQEGVSPQDLIEHCQLSRQTMSFITDPSTSTIKMRALTRMDRYEEALAESESAIAKAYCGQVCVMVPEIYRLRGDIFAKIEKFSEADDAYLQALESARSQGALSLELRALTSLIHHRYHHPLSTTKLLIELKYLLNQVQAEPSSPDLLKAQALVCQGPRPTELRPH